MLIILYLFLSSFFNFYLLKLFPPICARQGSSNPAFIELKSSTSSSQYPLSVDDFSWELRNKMIRLTIKCHNNCNRRLEILGITALCNESPVICHASVPFISPKQTEVVEGAIDTTTLYVLLIVAIHSIEFFVLNG
tara:strand:+ start:1156 stop:1563 length:408 start_codon:yes stop_codon:yes gene_type:complete